MAKKQDLVEAKKAATAELKKSDDIKAELKKSNDTITELKEKK